MFQTKHCYKPIANCLFGVKLKGKADPTPKYMTNEMHVYGDTCYAWAHHYKLKLEELLWFFNIHIHIEQVIWI